MAGLCSEFNELETIQNETLRKALVKRIHGRLESSRIEAAALLQVIDSPALSARERRALFRRWTDVTREGDLLELFLALIRRRERAFS